MSKTVSVVDAYAHAIEDVVSRAEQAFQENLGTYRRLVSRMAGQGGTLTENETKELLAACESLGIPPDFLSTDAVAVQTARDLESKIADIHQRNADKMAPLESAQAAFNEAQRVWLEVSNECRERMRVAETELQQRRREFEKIAGSRLESTEPVEREAIRIRDRHPHLFGAVSRERLQRIVDPNAGRGGL